MPIAVAMSGARGRRRGARGRAVVDRTYRTVYTIIQIYSSRDPRRTISSPPLGGRSAPLSVLDRDSSPLRSVSVGPVSPLRKARDRSVRYRFAFITIYIFHPRAPLRPSAPYHAYAAPRPPALEPFIRPSSAVRAGPRRPAWRRAVSRPVTPRVSCLDPTSLVASSV
jgi:hypothetical protein